MSIDWLSYVFKHGPTRLSDRLVLLALANFANAEGDCFPAVSTLLRQSGLSRRSVSYSLERLSADGFLEIQSGKGRKRTNRYRIKKVQTLHPEDSGNGAIAASMHSKKVQDLHSNGANVAHSPSSNLETIEDYERRARNFAQQRRAEFDLGDHERLLVALGLNPGSVGSVSHGRSIGGVSDVQYLQRWKWDLHLTIDEVATVVAEVMSRKPGSDPPYSFKYFDRPIQEFASEKHGKKLNSPYGGRTSGKPSRHTSKTERRLAAFLGSAKRA